MPEPESEPERIITVVIERQPTGGHGAQARAAISELWRWLSDALIRVSLWLCDRIAGPTPETKADRVRERAEAEKVVALPIVKGCH